MIPRLAALLMITASIACAEVPLTWERLSPLPGPLGVAGAFAGVSGGALLVAGGANFPGKMPWAGGKKVWHDRVWLLDRPDGVWREAGKLPRPLGYGVSVTARAGLICAGGSDEGRHRAEVFRLVWAGGELRSEPLPALPIALAGASGALVEDTLYVACGAEEPGEKSATNRAFALDLAAKDPAWKELPPVPGRARLFAAGAAQGGAFYLLGGAALEPDARGEIARVYLREAWRYRPATGWERLADLPKPSVAAPSPAPLVGGHLLLLGGDDGSRVGFQPIERHPGFPKTILSYDPALNRWGETGELPAARATLPCAEWLGRCILPSGEARPGVRSPEVWALRESPESR